MLRSNCGLGPALPLSGLSRPGSSHGSPRVTTQIILVTGPKVAGKGLRMGDLQVSWARVPAAVCVRPRDGAVGVGTVCWAPARQGELPGSAAGSTLLANPQGTGVPQGCAAGTELSTGGIWGQEL